MPSKINVRKVTTDEIKAAWGFLPTHFYLYSLYVRCNAKGGINWEKAPVYFYSELELRGNYSIIEK